MDIDELVEDYVVDLSIDNGGYKPTKLELELFLQANGLFVENAEFHALADKWCQK